MLKMTKYKKGNYLVLLSSITNVCISVMHNYEFTAGEALLAEVTQISLSIAKNTGI